MAALSINGSTLSLIGSIQPDAFPFGSVPLDKIDAIVTVVIDAAQMDRCGKAREPQGKWRLHAAEQRSDLSVPNWTQASDEKVLSRGGW